MKPKITYFTNILATQTLYKSTRIGWLESSHYHSQPKKKKKNISKPSKNINFSLCLKAISFG